MERKEFTTVINAPREKVWDILWNDATYREWTAVFTEGSHAITDWQKGSKVLFLDGNNNGMVSQIAENIPNEYMSIKHLGEVKGGVEDTMSQQVKQWAGSTENYTLKVSGEGTELTVDMAIPPEQMDYFTGVFPKALAKVKAIAER
ncbi:MAG: ATPase [Bacteroidetes bacterium 46-16]|nr:MAG: ATPase [Bacteroidetes bacterium 46-16]